MPYKITQKHPFFEPKEELVNNNEIWRALFSTFY